MPSPPTLASPPDPDTPELAHQRLQDALHLHRQGQLAAARSLYQALLPTPSVRPDALHLLGLCLCQQGEANTGLQLIRQAIQLAPDNPIFHANLANTLLASGQTSAAIDSLRTAQRLQPANLDLLLRLGLWLADARQPEAALQAYDQALPLAPNHLDTYLLRSQALSALNRPEEALACMTEALRRHPEIAGLHANLGNLLQQLERWDEAIASYDAATQIDPLCAGAHYNRGIVQRTLGRYQAAMHSYQQAIAAAPNYADALWHTSFLHLQDGNYAQGWPLFEWRQSIHQTLPFCEHYPKPQWDGRQPLRGKTILLHHEQGYGDTLQFVRYAPLVARLGAKVLLKVPAPLKRLLQCLDGLAEITSAPVDTDRFDLHCPMMSLPHAFQTTLDTIPSAQGYLRPAAADVRIWQQRLAHLPGRKVGLVWNGGYRPDQPEIRAISQRRDLPLEQIARLHSIPRISFISLQKGEVAERELEHRRDALWPNHQLHLFSPLLKDFADTAALIANLDLVIAVDTSTAHLAGAIGTPTWLLNRYDTCWRWLLERRDSPWYDAITLYRQQKFNDWNTVIEAVMTDLQHWAAQQAPHSKPHQDAGRTR